jgi:hypothetical protein
MQEMQESVGGMGSVRYVLSFGGGVNSVALMILLLRSNEPLDEVVFADTGAEAPETYAYLHLVHAYLRNHHVPLTILASPTQGPNLYRKCWDRKVIPSAIWRWSTRDFKITPIHRHYRSLGDHVNQYLAIAYDEIERMKDAAVSYVTNLYPLVDSKIRRAGCVAVIEEAGLPVPVKSGCFFCPFNSIGRWRWLYENHPDLYDKAMALEENSKHFPSQRLADQVFRVRANVTLRQLRDILKSEPYLPVDEEQLPCGAECMT